MKKILVINCGSSSLKFQLYDVEANTYNVVSKGIAERIGQENAVIKIAYGDGPKTEHPTAMPTHSEAIRGVFKLLLNGALKSMDELYAVGHRIVQGGDIFKESVLVTDQVIEDIASLSDLAPLHNPAHVLGIKAVKEVLPNIPQVVVFDTSFHQTFMPCRKTSTSATKSAVTVFTEHLISMFPRNAPSSSVKKAKSLRST